MSIKQIFTCENSICIVDNKNCIWLSGDNYHSRLGIMGKWFIRPFNTGIIMEDDEEIIRFFSHLSLTYIHTSKNNLWLSRYVGYSKKGHRHDKSESDSESDHEIDSYFDLSEDTLLETLANDDASGDIKCFDSSMDEDSIDFSKKFFENNSSIYSNVSEQYYSKEYISTICKEWLPSVIDKLEISEIFKHAASQVQKTLDIDDILDMKISLNVRQSVNKHLENIIKSIPMSIHPDCIKICLILYRFKGLYEFIKMLSKPDKYPHIILTIIFNCLQFCELFAVTIINLGFDKTIENIIKCNSPFIGIPSEPIDDMDESIDLINSDVSQTIKNFDKAPSIIFIQSRVKEILSKKYPYLHNLCSEIEKYNQYPEIVNNNLGELENNNKIYYYDLLDLDINGDVNFKDVVNNFFCLKADKVSSSENTLFWKLGDKHFIFSWALKPSRVIWKFPGVKIFPIISKDKPIYYRYELPLDMSVGEYFRDFVYFRNGDYHNVITAYGELSYDISVDFIWIYFKADNLEPEQIKVESIEGTIFVVNNDCIYRYLHSKQDIIPYIRTNKLVAFNNKYSSKVSIIFISGDNYVIKYQNNTISVPIPQRLEKIVSIFNSFNGYPIIVAHILSKKKYFVNGNSLVFNANMLDKYAEIAKGIIFLSKERDHVSICVRDRIISRLLVLVKKIEVCERSYYLYRVAKIPLPIQDIYFDKSSFVVKANDRYFNYIISYDDISKMELVLFEKISINKNLIFYPRVDNNDIVRINISCKGERLQHLIMVSDMLEHNRRLEITYVNNRTPVSYGLGLLNVFIGDAILEFDKKYLTRNKYLSELKLDAFAELENGDIYGLGSILHYSIIQIQNHLPVHLPLTIIEALARRKPTDQELEYFLKKNSPDIYKNVISYRNKSEEIKELGFDTYRECLEILTLYKSYDNNKRRKRISYLMALGIMKIAKIKNLKKMNYPTIDFYLSGLFKINRKKLIRKISCEDRKLLVFFKSFIKKIDETELEILLKNWGGTTFVLSGKYNLTVPTNDCNLVFQTCSKKLVICKSLKKILLSKKNTTEKQILVSSLTSPINDIRD